MPRSSGHQQVFLLTAAQALFQTSAVMLATIGGLAGLQVASSPNLATLPVSAAVLGTAALTFPASFWMAKVGRRAGFMSGTLFGVAGGLLAALGIYLHSLALLAAGTFLAGGYQAFSGYYRFAATEVAEPAFQSRAISLVLTGGVVAAILGPALARWSAPMLEPQFVATLLLIAAISLVATVVLTRLHVPEPVGATAVDDKGRPWQEIVRQPQYLVALFGALTGYGVMILAMTATPLAMLQHHHGLDATATVIQFHVLGMFVPSFFTGALIARFGVLRIMLTGVAFFAAHIITTLTGTGFSSFAVALVFLGVGWNFLFIGGTTLLTGTYSPAEKARAQAINDMTIFFVGATCSFAAAALLNALGWQNMNLLLLPWLAVAAASFLWLGARQRQLQTA